MPDADHWVRSYVSQSFNRDAVLVTELGAAFNITPLFAPMVERREVRPVASGSQSLSYIVPNVGSLPWEAIVEFREHPGSKEARLKLREFDERAANDPRAAYEYMHRAGQEITSALFAALKEQRNFLAGGTCEGSVVGRG